MRMRFRVEIIVVMAIMLTVFAGVALAAENTNRQVLGESGIIMGGTSGDSLDDTSWKREDVVVLLTRLYGKTEEEMKSTIKTHTFTDVSNPYYDGFLSWVVDEKLVNGRSDTIFGFGDFITAQEFSALLLRVIGVEFEYKDAINVAVEVGILTEALPNHNEVTRNHSYEGIVNALNSQDEHGVTLGERLHLPNWIKEESEIEQPPVSEDLINDSEIIEVTLNESFFLGLSFSDIKEDARLMGIDDVTLNADHSVTYRMTKKQHMEIVDEMKNEVYIWMDETINHMDSVSKMTINDTLTELKVFANENKFTEQADHMQFFGIAFQVAIIQLFNLVELEDVQFKILYINEDTEVVFYSEELENYN